MSIQQTTEGLLLRNEIVERGYAEFDHNISSDEVDQLMSCYTDFTTNHPNPLPETLDAMLPPTSDHLAHELDELTRENDTQAEWHKYRTNVPGVGKPDGYTNRSYATDVLKRARGIDIHEDPKEYYHHTPVHYAAMARMHEMYGWGPIPNEVRRLDSAFRPIHQKARNLITRVCALIEETHPEISEVVTPTSLRTSPIRLLYYHPSDVLQLANGHRDKGMTTLQLAESHEGLRIASSKDAPLEPVIRDAEKAVFFPALDMARDFGDDTPFQPSYHDVIRIDHLNQGRSLRPKTAEVCARWALIFFAHGNVFIQPGKDATHRR